MKKKIIVCVALLLALCVTSACSSDKSLDAVKERDVLRVGVKNDVPGFGYLNPATGKMEGMEIDLARLIAEDLLGDENKLEFVEITTKTRGPMLESGELDMAIANFTITEERKEKFNFTTAYYIDEIGFLVKKADGYQSIPDLKDKTIGIVQASTAKDAIVKEGEELGLTFKFQEYNDYPEIKSALLAGRIDAFSVDKAILHGYVDAETAILPDGLSPQEYGIGTKKENAALAAYLDERVRAYQENGELDKLIAKWNLDN